MIVFVSIIRDTENRFKQSWNNILFRLIWDGSISVASFSQRKAKGGKLAVLDSMLNRWREIKERYIEYYAQHETPTDWSNVHNKRLINELFYLSEIRIIILCVRRLTRWALFICKYGNLAYMYIIFERPVWTSHSKNIFDCIAKEYIINLRS